MPKNTIFGQYVLAVEISVHIYLPSFHLLWPLNDLGTACKGEPNKNEQEVHFVRGVLLFWEKDWFYPSQSLENSNQEFQSTIT